ncbi:hypothetical protein MKX01_029024, partial [Papaver californicum]
MAGLSLQCGDCGVLLKSVEEAQEHAELTSHSNFAESTEAVLNLVCSTCRKPCRSKTESDLHTKRTGHTDFVDKTLETVNPISLELPKPSVDSDGVAGASTSDMETEGEEFYHKFRFFIVVYIFLWIISHTFKTIQVPVNRKAESRKPSLTPEEMKIKAQELR